ncbi:uncharacterized protein LOC132271201 isoform X2 [Cornus florida]|uniref:uncharacterized protein LOC132271201 isoform X2 n=1 Tax=Cornus florida TaxID=4283 RepID=UPI00289786F8|nr:uncharacterized protein LOC132271201 isoform X2 [Cornus florida]
MRCVFHNPTIPKTKAMSTETEYHSKDFEWDQLREEIENDPSLRYHFQLSSQPETIQFSPSLSSHDSQAWDNFHTRHSTGKFFKERRYLLKEFPELASCDENSKVLEVGCGNGSTALPILRGKERIIVCACDCSTEALERAKELIYATNIVSVSHRFRTFHCDFSVSGFPKWLACNLCQEIFSKKGHNCFSDFSDKMRNDLNDFFSSEGNYCCMGGVDFITLGESSCWLFPVCVIHQMGIQKSPYIHAISSTTSQNANCYRRVLLCFKTRWPTLIQGLWPL